MSKKLPPRQQIFVKEYLCDLNAKQAALRAGYSPKSVENMVTHLLAKKEIQEAIHKEMDKRSKKIELTAEMVLENIMRLSQKAEDAGEIANALKGNELLGKHLKLFTDKVEHSGNVQFTKIEREIVDPKDA